MLHGSLGEEVAAAFGLGSGARLRGPVATGRLGRIWQLTTAAGRFAVKDFVVAPTSAEAERDAVYQDAVRASGVPMPPVVRARDGSVLAHVSGPVRVYGWVDVARKPDRRVDPASVGRLVAAVHRVEVPTDEPVDGWYVDPVPREHWQEMTGRLATAGAPFAGRLSELVPELAALAARLAPPRRVQMCHRDLWADNVLRDPDGGLVVLDWENSGPAGPEQELAMVLFEFGCGDPGRMAALHDAYRAAGGPARVSGAEDLTMLVAQSQHNLWTACERWLAATSTEQREDNAAWAAEFLDDPVTTRTVDLVLSAVPSR